MIPVTYGLMVDKKNIAFGSWDCTMKNIKP